jgi:hypothetical protein
MIMYDTEQCKGPFDTQTFLHVQQSITDSTATGLLVLYWLPLSKVHLQQNLHLHH